MNNGLTRDDLKSIGSPTLAGANAVKNQAKATILALNNSLWGKKNKDECHEISNQIGAKVKVVDDFLNNRYTYDNYDDTEKRRTMLDSNEQTAVRDLSKALFLADQLLDKGVFANAKGDVALQPAPDAFSGATATTKPAIGNPTLVTMRGDKPIIHTPARTSPPLPPLPTSPNPSLHADTGDRGSAPKTTPPVPNRSQPPIPNVK
jgi:hypothetical protein